MTIDELINALINAKKVHGGNTTINANEYETEGLREIIGIAIDDYDELYIAVGDYS